MAELSLNEEFGGATRDDWLALVAKVLNGADFDRRLTTDTDDGLTIQPLYTRADEINGLGAQPVSRTGGGWDIRQLHIERDTKALNAALLEDLTGGVTSLAIQMEAPGQSGLPVSPEAFNSALDGVDLAICPIALQPGENFGAAAAYLLGNWATRKIAPDARQGAFNADPLGTLAASGALTHSLAQSMDSAIALVARAQDMPQVTAMIADGRLYHAAGATEAQELAIMLATLVAYLRAAEDAGIAPANAFPKIAVGLAADTDQFLTIAKLRAARRLLARMADAAGIGNAEATTHITTTTSWRMLAKRDPWVNMLRTTIACAAAAMGGADAITVLPYTTALGKPDSFARRIARNTQIVLQEESSLGRVADPAAGSWYVESLTDDLARRAWEIFQSIGAQKDGNERGMAAALQTGMVQDMIAKSAASRQTTIETGRRALTGVSAFPQLGDDGVSVEPHDAPLPCATGGASVTPLSFKRLAEPFEALRDRADKITAKTGATPTVFLVNLGQQSDFAARSTWAKNFFAAGGIDVIASDGFTSSTDAGAAFAASGATIACLCSSDTVYGELAEATASLLKTAGTKRLYLAGRPREFKGALKTAGVDEFLFAGCDAVALLGNTLKLLGTIDE